MRNCDVPVLGHAALRSAIAALDRDRAFDRVDDAAELDQHAIAHQLDDAAVMLGDQRVRRALAARFERSERPRLVAPISRQ